MIVQNKELIQLFRTKNYLVLTLFNIKSFRLESDIMNRSERNAYSRRYYKANPEYRKKKIEHRKKYYREHQKDQNKKERERYQSDAEYTRYKIKYAKKKKKKHK